MSEQLKVIFVMIKGMEAVDYGLTNEQQVLAVIRSLLKPSWEQVKLVITYNEAIKPLIHFLPFEIWILRWSVEI